MRSLIAPIVQFFGRLRNGMVVSHARFHRQVYAANLLGDDLRAQSDHSLRARIDQLRTSTRRESLTESQAVELMAIAREAAARTLGLRPYDVQMLAAFAMHDGRCVEMQTGEGKTLAAALTVCVRGLSGRGVHVLTFNDYLAERDANWMQPLFGFFGLTAGHVCQGMPSDERRRAYACDVTYATAKEAGFDHLRDHNCQTLSDRVQRGFPFAIIDEADSILIDEARIPLVIAAEAERDGFNLDEVAEIARGLQKDSDFEIKDSGRNVALTETGILRLERRLGCGELHSEENVALLTRINLALQAQELVTRDTDYIVRNGAIELIDEFTGRVAENRKWPGGLQAALEAKEGLAILPQGQILNSITLQHFLEQYEQLAGMTGTAKESAHELWEFYDLKVVIVEPNRPCIRIDHADRVFSSAAAKHQALLDEIASQHEAGRPVLVGTASVKESDDLARDLQQRGVTCRVLNAANDHEEAEIIAEAGALHAVTISTNMAGRGTDIRLGGSDQATREQVVALGGLYVIGTNRHESRRIDNQLRGRSGRQGDPGESRFFVSVDDELVVRHGIQDLISDMSTDGPEVRDPKVTRQIENVQRMIEGESFEIRRTLRKYSILLDIQRRKMRTYREALLHNDAAPTSLEQTAPELQDKLIQRWGKELIERIERQVTLIHIDRCWSDHLTHAAEIREGIHLVSLGGFNAFDAFNRQMTALYRSFRNRIDQEVVATLSTATITADGIDPEREGLSAPSSTWTFMINDNPAGSVLDRLTKGLWRLVRGKSLRE